MKQVLEHFWQHLSSLGVRNGFQLTFHVGLKSSKCFSYPPVRLWALRRYSNLGDSTRLLLKSHISIPSEGLKDILSQICDELGEDSGDTDGFAVFDSVLQVVANFAAFMSDAAVLRFQLNINYFPGFAGPKIDLWIYDVDEQYGEFSLPGCLFLSSSKEDFLEAFDEVIAQVRVRLWGV